MSDFLLEAPGFDSPGPLLTSPQSSGPHGESGRHRWGECHIFGPKPHGEQVMELRSGPRPSDSTGRGLRASPRVPGPLGSECSRFLPGIPI